MSDNEINIAIAAHFGWNFNPSECNGWVYPDVWCRNPEGKLHFRHRIPDFCRDLNAMHEAENTFADDDVIAEKYWLALCDATGHTRWPYDATARQRAEAFLRTIGKWKEAA